MERQIKLLLADDHNVVRQGISLILREAFGNIDIIQAGDLTSALAALKQAEVDLLLLDINLPGGNSVSMISDIKAANSTVKILMFSAHDEEHYALRYIHAGADGYLNKLSSEEEIIEAVSTILEKGKYVSRKIGEALTGSYHNPLDALSGREMEIAALMVKGEGNLEIANLLGIRTSTVSTYKKRIFEKLEITNLPCLIDIFKLHSEV